MNPQPAIPNPQLWGPPRELEIRAVNLAADVYLPRPGLEAKYPGAVIIEAGCDRCMVVKLASPVNPSESFLWIVFRGTCNVPGWESDLDALRYKIADPRIEVHAGFNNGLDLLWRNLCTAIAALGDSRLIFVGHSRGATMAILAADRYRNHCAIAWVIPFAPARPGNAAFRDRYNAVLGGRTYFFHHGADIVSWEAPYLLGWRHCGHRVWFPDCGCVQPSVDPCLLRLALNVGWLCYRRGMMGLVPMLEDHGISTYQKLLT